MHDDKAMQVLEEIRDLIQERIGSSIKPDAVEIKALSMEPDKGDDAMGI
jgi:CO dehydrogenase/acetyl-CoA synthase gamma subunit (corrinoid Fe-S protein)